MHLNKGWRLTIHRRKWNCKYLNIIVKKNNNKTLFPLWSKKQKDARRRRNPAGQQITSQGTSQLNHNHVHSSWINCLLQPSYSFSHQLLVKQQRTGNSTGITHDTCYFLVENTGNISANLTFSLQLFQVNHNKATSINKIKSNVKLVVKDE